MSFPPGKLICCQSKDHCKWYQSDGHHKKYISKKNRKLAEELAQKKYLSLQLEDLKNEKTAIEFYLRHHSPTGKANQLLIEPSEYQRLLSPYFTPLSKELANWASESYERNSFHPENLQFQSSSGNLVRSKSEMLIDMFLHINKIPFRYENPLYLGDFTYYPDFTIRHPKTGEFFYWEHFGLMDNPSYSNSAFNKLQRYATHGIIPGINLISTFETKEHPLCAQTVSKIIEDYFL